MPMPLAEKLRPKNLSEYIGQRHLLDENRPLHLFLQHQFLPSLIFYGPAGVGKTSLVQVLAQHLQANLHSFSAVHTGVKEIKETIEVLRKKKSHQEKNLLFIDEIHRFSKSQQDALLAAVEKGWVTFIGATTENPSFEIIPALLSRTQIYTLQKLTTTEMQKLINRALTLENRSISEVVQDQLLMHADGDGRRLLNSLEQLFYAFSDEHLANLKVEELTDFWSNARTLAHDKEAHYDLISALIKSIRGSDEQAAIYWLARLLHGGEDLIFIARRLIISASEDIGLANPNALLLANQTFEAVQKIGMPEARIPLAMCVMYLAKSGKNNRAYCAIDAALNFVAKNPAYPVPLHLRNPATAWMKNQGYGKDYIYTHDDPNTPQSFLPNELETLNFC